MKTFILKLVFEVTVAGEHQHFDEQVRMFNGINQDQVYEAANSLGEKEAQQFVNTRGEMIEWKFFGITDIIELSGKSDGSLLFSESRYNDDIKGYAGFIKSKAIAVTGRIPTFV